MRVIGLTGGIACGKSTVAGILRELSARVVDADEVARELLAPGSPVLARVAERFGRKVLREDGSLDRQRLAEIVFRDRQALADLNAITHPPIVARIRQRIQEARREGVRVLVIDAPLLLEAGMQGMVDEVWVVTCTRDQQIERLCRRTGLSPSEAEARTRAQMPLEEKLGRADRVIPNEGSLAQLRAEVERHWQDLASRRI
ncbi:MAG: dephospho-CoA kinase [Bacillota bacterium]|nr:dephospho-CoA kinase [Bacillota bacterium]MDI7250101.1 dephospho-CoA kinase [Bacillota bacterium]